MIDVLAHRGNVEGPVGHERENTLPLLRAAIGAGFGVEFDVQCAPGDARLVLSHDPADWAPSRDPEQFLAAAANGVRHALNVKHLPSLPALLARLEAHEVQDDVFLFDFELLEPDRRRSRRVMDEVTARGFVVAHRLSDREPFLDEYAGDPAVRRIWLDEFDRPWVTGDVLARLVEAGKTVVYVSPELHRRTAPDARRRRWDAVVGWGIHGICTDHGAECRRVTGGDG